MLQRFVGTVSCGVDLLLEQWKSVRSPLAEEEGAERTPCDEVTRAPFPSPLCCWNGGGRETGREADPG